MEQFADIILKSNCIFTAKDQEVIDGYVAIQGNRIIAVEKGEIPNEMISKTSKVICLKDKTVSPGFVDVHCFFTGYVVRFLGCDLSVCHDKESVFKQLDKYLETSPKNYPLLAHGLNIEISKEELDERYKIPVILFVEGCDTCAMNQLAMDKYNFSPTRCYPEAYVKIFPYILGNKEFIKPQFIEYMKMMNSNGITSIKEMGFDNFYSFTEVLDELEKENKLTCRVNFMSQPVDKEADFEYGVNMANRFHSEKLAFSGYNQMTDGSVSEYCADIKKPYNNTDTCCKQEINWEKLKEDTLKADKLGFRFSLHAQGDAAIAKVVDIYEQCQKDANGKLVNRHAITDLEFSDPVDLERMGKIGAIAEIYPQIQSLANKVDKLKMIEEKIGMERGKNYWNRKKMADSNVVISCGTDLPLLIDNIPESIYHACGGYFKDGGEPFNKENMLNVYQIMKAWTYGGAYNLSREKVLGTLEVGKLADIAILSDNIFTKEIENIKETKVYMTIVDGKIVYKGE